MKRERNKITLKNNKNSKRIYINFCVFILLILLIFVPFIHLLVPIILMPFIYLSMNSSLSNNYNVDYLIVLGNKSINNVSSKKMKERLDLTVSFTIANPQTTIILTGGSKKNNSNSEAEIMQKYLMEHSVTNKIIIENNSINTYENLYYSSQLMKGNAVVISSDYHIFRIKLVMIKQGLNYKVIGSNTKKNKLFYVFCESYNCLYEIISALLMRIN